jgi:hypothetical protein
MRMYVVKHRTCGHYGGAGPSRDAAVQSQRVLEMTGNHGWRIETLTGTEDELMPVLAAIASGERCEACDVAENIKMVPNGMARGHGVHVDASRKAHATITDPGAGEHLWVVVSAHRVVPVDGGTYELDLENLLSVDGPGCFKCEEPYTEAVAARPCTGSLEELQP